jgi:hypothetical protein
MDKQCRDRANTRITAVLCTFTVLIILVAGLWPFHPPKNQVEWVENENANEFGRYGSILTAGTFHTSPSNDDTSGSIEVWLEPRLFRGKKTILAFDSSEHPGDPFLLIQSGDALVIQRYNIDDHGICRTAQFAAYSAQKDRYSLRLRWEREIQQCISTGFCPWSPQYWGHQPTT